MEIENKTLEFQTKEIFHFIDFTNKVKDFVKKAGVKNGLVNIQIMHTSAGLILNENEPLLLEDIKEKFEKHASQKDSYKHDDLTKRTVNVCNDECVNGHSHCNAIYLQTTVTLNVFGGELQLGRWQNVMLVELDRSRPRKIQLQIIGE